MGSRDAVDVARAGVKLRRVSTSRSRGVALRVRKEARPLDEVAVAVAVALRRREPPEVLPALACLSLSLLLELSFFVSTLLF